MKNSRILRYAGITCSILSLVMLIIPVLLFMNNAMSLAAVKNWMLVATIIWFVVTPFWMERSKKRET